MIGAISLMRRRGDISQAAFQKHWLEVHGPLVCAMPGLRRYQQAYITEALSIPAEIMAVDGFAQLFFASVEARAVAYASAELAACDRDSPLFIDAVTRAITEIPDTAAEPSPYNRRSAHKLMVLVPPGEPAMLIGAAVMERLVGCSSHTVISQGAAPNSVVAEFHCPIRAILELWFATESGLHEAAPAFQNCAVYQVREHEFI